jgi:AraC-like DNA-binding protein
MTKRTKKPPKKTGRPRVVLDENALQLLAQVGCTYEEMAAHLNTSPDTLSRRFKDVIETARQSGRTSLRRAQWKAALGGNTTMMIWLGKQELGQRDKHDLEHAGKDGAPLVPPAINVILVKP